MYVKKHVRVENAGLYKQIIIHNIVGNAGTSGKIDYTSIWEKEHELHATVCYGLGLASFRTCNCAHW